jgi:hypothetical protein
MASVAAPEIKNSRWRDRKLADEERRLTVGIVAKFYQIERKWVSFRAKEPVPSRR